MTIHEQTQFRSLASGPNPLAAIRLANAVQRHRVQGGSTICSRLPPSSGNMSASQSAQDLQALIQSALEVAEALDLPDAATMSSSALSSNTNTQDQKEEEQSDSEPRPNERSSKP